MSDATKPARRRTAPATVVQSVAAFDIARSSANPTVQDALTNLVCAVALAHPEELAAHARNALDFARSPERGHERAFRAVTLAVNTNDREMSEAVDRMVDLVSRKHPRHFHSARR